MEQAEAAEKLKDQLVRNNPGCLATLSMIGVVRDLVDLLASSSDDLVLTNVLVLLATMAEKRVENRAAIVDVEGLTQLLNLLENSTDPLVLSHVASVLGIVVSGHIDYQNAIGLQGIEGLKRLLESDNNDCRLSATVAIGDMVQGNLTSQNLVCSQRVLPLLLSLLKTKSDGIKKAVLITLGNLIESNPAVQEALRIADGKRYLKNLHGSRSAEIERRALLILAEVYPSGAASLHDEMEGLSLEAEAILASIALPKPTSPSKKRERMRNDEEDNRSIKSVRSTSSKPRVEPIEFMLKQLSDLSYRENALKELAESIKGPSNVDVVFNFGGLDLFIQLLEGPHGALSIKEDVAVILAKILHYTKDEQTDRMNALKPGVI